MLSTEQFAELITMIETSCDDGPKPDVRRSQRIAHPCRISICQATAAGTEPPRLVQLKDISVRGICFLHDSPLEPGAPLIVNLEAPNGSTHPMLSTVVHCQQINKHTYQIGAEFTSPHVKQQEPSRQYSPEDLMRIRTSILS